MPLELFALAVLAIAVAVWLIVRQQNLRLRQMQHRERLAAIEREPREDLAPQREGDAMTDPMIQWKDPENYMNWARYTTLGLAFLLMFGGVGVLTALMIVEDPELRKLWSVGLIPMMTGAGLFLFWLVTTTLLREKKD